MYSYISENSITNIEGRGDIQKSSCDLTYMFTRYPSVVTYTYICSFVHVFIHFSSDLTWKLFFKNGDLTWK